MKSIMRGGFLMSTIKFLILGFFFLTTTSFSKPVHAGIINGLTKGVSGIIGKIGSKGASALGGSFGGINLGGRFLWDGVSYFAGKSWDGVSYVGGKSWDGVAWSGNKIADGGRFMVGKDGFLYDTDEGLFSGDYNWGSSFSSAYRSIAI